MYCSNKKYVEFNINRDLVSGFPCMCLILAIISATLPPLSTSPDKTI